MLANRDKVLNLIPQKSPFVMVDELMNYSENKLRSRFTIQSANLFFYKNFFIESGIIENMAQSVALHTGYQFFLRNEIAPTGYIGSINKVEINRLPLLGEVLETEISILQEFMGVTLVDVEVMIKGEVIAKGQMKTVLSQ